MNLPCMLCNESSSIKVFIDTGAHSGTAYLILNSMIMTSVTAYLCAFMSELDWEGALEWNEKST